MIEKDGVVHDDPANVAEILVDHFAETTSDDLYNLHFRKKKDAAEQIPIPLPSDTSLDKDFSLDEMLFQLDRLKGSSPGPDGIHNKMLQNLPACAKLQMLSIFNDCWQQGVFPDVWKEGHAIAIPKPGKDALNLENQRVIVLNSTPGKLLERMVARRLSDLLEERELLDPRQFAFRRGRSTTDHLALLEDTIRNAWQNKEHVEAAFVDISKAYDRTWRRLILKQLSDWNIGGKVFRFLENFMRGREVRVRVGNKLSSSRLLENGVVQGSVLSVLLFLIAIASIFRQFSDQFQVLVYADDIVIIVSHKNPVQARKLLKQAFQKLNNWSKETGFEISKNKTKAMHFCRSRDHDTCGSPVLFRGSKIEFVSQYKLLGITVDRKLTYRVHTEELKVECLKRLKIVRWCGGVRYGGEQKTVIRIYNALVHSKLMYAFPAWSSASKTARKKLNSVQTQGIRLATGAFRSSPIESVLVDAGELPSEIQMEAWMLCFAMKVRASPNIFPDPNIWAVKRAQEIARRRGILLPKVSRRCTEDSLWKFDYPDVCFDLWSEEIESYPNHVLRRMFKEVEESKFEFHQKYFTDGSKSDAGVGCSVVSSEWKRRAKLPESFSVFTAEAQAICWAVENAQKNVEKTVIFSDSKSVLEATLKGKSDHPLVKEISLKCRQNRNISLCWVPSHVGIQGNDDADKEAKEAAAEDEEIIASTPWRDACKHIKRKLSSKWLDEWDTSEQKLRRVKGNTTRWKTSDRCNRWEEVVISRLRIGHTRLTHGHLMGGLDSGSCEVCDAPISVQHILVDCRKYEEYREKHSLGSSLATILGDNDREIAKLLAYLKDTRLFYEI